MPNISKISHNMNHFDSFRLALLNMGYSLFVELGLLPSEESECTVVYGVPVATIYSWDDENGGGWYFKSDNYEVWSIWEGCQA